MFFLRSLFQSIIKWKLISALFCSALLITIVLDSQFSFSSDNHSEPTGQVVIEHFHSDITIQPSGNTHYKTDITSLFDGDGWSGLLWKIPTSYSNHAKGTNYTIGVDIRSITDASGNPYKYETSEQDDSLIVKIFVPKPDHSQAEIYLDYSTSNQILFFEDHDEFYLTLVEPSGSVQYSDVSASIHLPQGTTGVSATAGFGPLDGEKTDLEATVNGQLVEVVVPESPLSLADGVTFDVSFDKGLVKPPLGQAIGLLVAPYSGVILLLPAVYGLYLFRSWYIFRKSWSSKSIVISYKPPSDLPAPAAGALIDRTIDSRDILSILFELSIKGLILIREPIHDANLDSKGFDLELLISELDWPTSLTDYEVSFLRALFKSGASQGKLVSSSKICQYLSSEIPLLGDQIGAYLLSAGFLSSNALSIGRSMLSRLRDIVLLLFICSLIAVFVGQLAYQYLYINQPFGFVFVFSFLVLILGHFELSRRPTPKGQDVLRHLKGFEIFLSRVEKGKLDRSLVTLANFEAFLPYALSLGISSRWIRAFEDVLHVPPSWLYSDDFDQYSPDKFKKLMDSVVYDVSSSVNSSFTTYRSSANGDGPLSAAGFASGSGSRLKIGGGFSGGSISGF